MQCPLWLTQSEGGLSITTAMGRPAKDKERTMRHSLGKFVATAWVAFTCIALLGTPANADTIYYYTGSTYTTISTENILDRTTIPATVVPNPNAAADAVVVGTNLRGSVTFGFDMG
jgi:hypothetical protein